MRTVDDQVREYAQYADEALPWVSPTDVMEAVKIREATRWTLPPRKYSNAIAALSAAAVVMVLLGGVAWLVRSGGGATPVNEPGVVTTGEVTPTTEAAITTDTVAATEAELPTVPVEVTVEWTEVSEGNPPYAGPIDRTLGMPFIMYDGTAQRIAIVSGTDDTPYSLWTSEDGITWMETAISLPQQGPLGGWLESTPTGHWYVGRDPAAQLWYSADLVSGWDEINLDGLTHETLYTHQELYPLAAESEILSVATVGNTTLIAVQYTLVFDWDELLGIEPGTYDEYDYNYDGDEESTENRQIEQLDPIITLSGRVYEPEGRDTTLLRFIPLTSTDGLMLTDADSGETLFEFPNYEVADFDWEDVVGQQSWPRFETKLSTLYAVTPSGVKAVGPWYGEIGTSPRPESIKLIETHDGIIVIGRGGGERFDITSHITTDGESFEATSLTNPTVVYDQVSGYLYTPYVDPFFGWEYHLISPDGVNWMALNTIPDLEYIGTEVSTLTRLGDFWHFMKFGANDAANAHYVSADGTEWHESHDAGTPMRHFETPLAWGDRMLIFGSDSNWVGTVELVDE
jgi:hypothetical protein